MGGGKSKMSSGPVGEEACLKCHSMVRWNKEYAPIKALFATNKGLKTCLDEKTGNVPIHIAAQNGHLDIVKLLVEIGADVNAQNKGGQTALHMAREYGFFYAARVLVAAGADKTLNNEAGFAADKGIEGGCNPEDWLPALKDASSTAEIKEALDGLATQEGVDRADYAMAGMARKKQDKALWTDEIDALFKEVMRKL